MMTPKEEPPSSENIAIYSEKRLLLHIIKDFYPLYISHQEEKLSLPIQHSGLISKMRNFLLGALFLGGILGPGTLFARPPKPPPPIPSPEIKFPILEGWQKASQNSSESLSIIEPKQQLRLELRFLKIESNINEVLKVWDQQFREVDPRVQTLDPSSLPKIEGLPMIRGRLKFLGRVGVYIGFPCPSPLGIEQKDYPFACFLMGEGPAGTHAPLEAALWSVWRSLNLVSKRTP